MQHYEIITVMSDTDVFGYYVFLHVQPFGSDNLYSISDPNPATVRVLIDKAGNRSCDKLINKSPMDMLRIIAKWRLSISIDMYAKESAMKEVCKELKRQIIE